MLIKILLYNIREQIFMILGTLYFAVVAEVEDELEEMESATDEVTDEPTTEASAAVPVSSNQAAPLGSSSAFGNVITNGVSHLNETIRNEAQCLKSGGTCLPSIECPAGNLSAEKGLCPSQQSLGVECCHGRKWIAI